MGVGVRPHGLNGSNDERFAIGDLPPQRGKDPRNQG